MNELGTFIQLERYETSAYKVGHRHTNKFYFLDHSTYQQYIG